MLFAQHVFMAGWGVVDLAILIVVIAAIVALVFVALRQFGVAIPAWVVQVFWILVVCFVIIFAIKLVASMW
jgi:hypothetical protein